MPFRSRRTMQFASAALLLVASACSSDSTGPGQDPITGANAQDVGDAVVAGLYSAMLGLEGFDPGSGGLLLSRAGVPAGLSLSLTRAGCPEVTPDPVVDTDEDGVPDNAVFSFDAPDCDSTDGDTSFDYSGSFRVTDPGSTAGYDLDVDEMMLTATGPEGSFTLGFDGTRSARATTSTMSLEEAFGFMLSADGQMVLLLSAWSLGFTATTPGTVAFGSPVPDGALTVDGAYEVNAPEGRWVLVVDTVTPLGWDASCGDFVSGVIRAVASGAEGSGAVQVTFQGCGVEPQVVFVASNA